MKKLLIVVFLFAFVLQHAQQDSLLFADSVSRLSLKQWLLRTKLEVQTRSFFMSTINEGDLKDDYAVAMGAGISLRTQSFHGFQFAMAVYSVYNVMSGNINSPDSLTLLPNRYETGLFDLQHPDNKYNLLRLEELNLTYTRKKTSVMAGKLNLNTPFFNPQNGRMRPTFEEGVWLHSEISKAIEVNGGWMWKVSPRSTTHWVPLSRSVGIYSVGVNEDGQKSGYAGNIQGCSGIAIGNVSVVPAKHMRVHLWNAFFENVMNTSVAEFSLEQERSKKNFYEDLLYVHQDAVNHGGNKIQSDTYVSESAHSNAVSIRLGYKNKRMNSFFAYTHITGDGRYLMPREWGREPFYTFLQRERNEGAGNVHAFLLKVEVSGKRAYFHSSIGYGYYRMPDVTNYRLNKYGIPSYHQLNYEATYRFEKLLKGLDLKFLAVYKINAGNTYGNLRYVYNKVNMLNLNFVVDLKI